MEERNVIPHPAVYELFNNSFARYCVPTEYAVDCYQGDCALTNKYGQTILGYETPVPINASDIGVKVFELD